MTKPVPTIRDYLRMAFRRKTALFVPMIFFTLLIAPLWMVMPPSYRAAARIRRTDLTVTSATGSIAGKGSPTISAKTLREEILTQNSLRNVIESLKLNVGVPAEQRQRVYLNLIAAISVEAKAAGFGRDIVEIAVIWNDPKMAMSIANAIANHLVETSKSANYADSQKELTFLQDETNSNKAKLDQIEKELDKYARVNYAGLPAVKSDLMSRLFSLKTEYSTQQRLLKETEDRLKQIEEQLEDVEVTILEQSSTQENPGAIELRNQLIQRQKHLEALLVTYTDEHERVRTVKSEILTIEEQLKDIPQRVPGEEREVINPIYQALIQGKMNAQQEISGKRAAINELSAQIADVDKKVQGVVNEETNYNDLVRQHQEALELYNQYRKALMEARGRRNVESKGVGSYTEILDPAMEPMSPYRARNRKMAIMCLAAGIALGISLLFSLEFSDHSIRNRDDAALHLQMPVLSTLSSIDEASEAAVERRKFLYWSSAFVFLAGLLLTATILLKFYIPELFKRLQEMFF